MYFSSLNSTDLYDQELPLRSSRSFGGTMVMWLREYDQFITLPPVSSPSLLPFIFHPPGMQLSIHVAIYLPTAGREEEYIEALAELDACINELREKYPDAPIFLRGDFNASLTNVSRSKLLEFFCSSQDLLPVDIPHPTYHHFLGNGTSDSHLDRIFHSHGLPIPEKLSMIHCKLNNPLIESHHDLLVSKVQLPHAELGAHQGNVHAPRIENHRTKIKWTDAGIKAYNEAVTPLLKKVQDVWLSHPHPSRSVISLCLQSTHRVLVETACATNKTVHLGIPPSPKPSFMSAKIRKSQNLLLRNQKEITRLEGLHCEVNYLKKKQAIHRTSHRKLIRAQNAAESIQRDIGIFEILEKDPRKIFRVIKASKAGKTRKISKLTVDDRTYHGDSVPDGFFDSLQQLKSMKQIKIQNQEAFKRYDEDFENIMEICRAGKPIPKISIETSRNILKKVKPDVSDYYSITANHYLYAGDAGIVHFHLLIEALITDINNISIEEVNTVHATILFKGHSKDKSKASSYRTISCCPLTAKCLDIYVRDLNIKSWDRDQASTQFLGEGSSHELAALLLTEVSQHSLHILHQPLFILYLDAKSAFDRVLRKLLIRNLYFVGTEGEELLLLNKRLEFRQTFAEWDKQMMGPIHDELGVEQGGVSSGDFYKIYAKNQLQLAQSSNLGVRLARDIIVSAIGQADDVLLVSNNLHSLQNLLQLSLFYCAKYNVELCPTKTKLQVLNTTKMRAEVAYLKEFSPVKLNGRKLEFEDNADHVGIVRSVTGNLPNILTRITAHKNAVAAVLHAGAAHHHRGNPAASLRLQQVYGFPVLLSGLGALVLSKLEISMISRHYQRTLQLLLRLHQNTPHAVCYFLAGCLPGEALLHLRQLSILGMIASLPGTLLHAHALNAFTIRSSSKSWFYQVRDLCLMYQLPHPLTVLTPPIPYSKQSFKRLAKKQVISYWETRLRKEACPLKSLQYFKPHYMSLTTPHPSIASAGPSPYEVSKALVQVLFLSGRYRTEKLCRFWSNNPNGYCLGPLCRERSVVEDEEHILLQCRSLATTRQNLLEFTMSYARLYPFISETLLRLTNPNHPQFTQFIIDCSVIPEVIALTQTFGQIVLNHLFKVTRTWCYSLHRDRLKFLGRWRSF